MAEEAFAKIRRRGGGSGAKTSEGRKRAPDRLHLLRRARNRASNMCFEYRYPAPDVSNVSVLPRKRGGVFWLKNEVGEGCK